MAKIFAAIIGMSTGRRQVPAVAKGENEQAADSDGPLVVSLVTEQQLGMAATDSHWTMAQVLAYWHAVEMFDPHGIPRPLRREALDREPGTRCVEALKLEAGQPLPVLPWQPEHPRHGEAPRPSTYGSTWRHTVYGGVYSFQVIRAALAKALRYEEEEDYGGRNKDAEGALFAVTVDADGVVLDDTPTFSSCAWATGRLYVPGPGAPGWLDGFDDLSGECEEALYRLLAQPVRYFPPRPGESPGTGKAGSGDPGRTWAAVVTDILGAAAAGAVAGLIGTLAPVLGGVAGAGAIAGMSGSLIGRLTQRAEEAERHEAGQSETGQPEAAQPVSSEAGTRRSLQLPDLVAFAAYVADILRLPASLADYSALRIESVPVSRKKDGSLPDPKPAFLSSLIAPDLRRVAAEVSRDPHAAGPALTSYLGAAESAEDRVDLARDRAAVIEGVQPAAFPLARWPADPEHSLVAGQQFAVNMICSELARIEGAGLFSVNGPPGTGKTTMLRDLIASVELPAAGAIGADWRDKASYFADEASAFLGEPLSAWGMVAAPLGNKDKRTEFRKKFWWAKGVGMQYTLVALEAEPHMIQWQEAVSHFNAALDAAAHLADDRQAPVRRCGIQLMRRSCEPRPRRRGWRASALTRRGTSELVLPKPSVASSTPQAS
jgi:hypothetical protein